MEQVKIDKLNNWQDWEQQLLTAAEYSFLQAWQMGDLQQRLGQQVGRLLFKYGKADVLLAQYFVIKAKRGKVLQLRHAPVFLPQYAALPPSAQLLVLNEFLAEIRNLALAERCHFIRLQPLVRLDDGFSLLPELMAKAGYKPAKIHNIDAEKTLILDITKEPEALLEQMRKQTRYYIRKAEKMGVKVTCYQDLTALEKFYNIHHDTTIRQQFTSYSHKYYQESFMAFNAEPGSKLRAEVFLAEYEGKEIAGAIIVYFGAKAFYSDGGSLTAYSKIPASYLIQWRAIERARELGAKTYNFWGGVSPDQENKNYPWSGIDLFKRGFAGERVEYMHVHDLGLNWFYYLTRLWESWEKFRRGY